MKIVVISQNQSDYIIKMIDSLADYKRDILYVLDRCTDNSKLLLTALNINYIETDNNLQGRQTSTARNLGASIFPNDDILFLDGDRYIINGDIITLSNIKEDIALLRLEHDNRPADINISYGQVYNCFYSAGIFIKNHVIKQIINKYNELFPTWIQEHWGLEDCTLGDICYDMNFTATYYNNCLLHGTFEKVYLDDIHYLIPRLQFRDKLKVKF